ncbi:MAG: FHA domain-containing protein, partial [Gammaproteobacteria bacterium]|nr:FHA domain-containing protein [Gammaproteobacteria bacterium]
KPSELYRIALKAIDYLAQQPGGQRTLLLFSDGKSDDTAYSHQDVIAAARSHQVMIYTIGYPARAGDGPVTLQTLRRLAEESAGLFIPLSPDFALPSEFAAAPLAIERSGGKSTFDLSGIGLRGDTAVTFIAGRDSVPAILPAIATPGLIRATAQGPGAGSVPAPIVDTFGMFGLVAVGGSMLLLLAFALVKRQHRPAEAPNGNVHANRDEDRGRTTQDSLEPDPPSDNGDALGTAMVTPSSSVTAYLHHQRDPTTRYALLAKTFSVGRSAENDLTLRDPSISRHHAEVRRRPDETFHVTDLDSMNGIYVNEKRVRSAPLCDGDTVEFGDVVMQFSIETEQLGAPESTDETLDTPRVTPGDIPKN